MAKHFDCYVPESVPKTVFVVPGLEFESATSSPSRACHVHGAPFAPFLPCK